MLTERYFRGGDRSDKGIFYKDTVAHWDTMLRFMEYDFGTNAKDLKIFPAIWKDQNYVLGAFTKGSELCSWSIP